MMNLVYSTDTSAFFFACIETDFRSQVKELFAYKWMLWKEYV